MLRANNTVSIIIDLALDHSDYYTHVGSVFLVRDSIADFVCRRATDRFVVRHGPVAECFLRHWHRQDDAERVEKLDNEDSYDVIQQR